MRHKSRLLLLGGKVEVCDGGYKVEGGGYEGWGVGGGGLFQSELATSKGQGGCWWEEVDNGNCPRHTQIESYQLHAPLIEGNICMEHLVM